MVLIDKFGEVIDEFLTENEIFMQILMPKGSYVPEIEDNTGGGAVIQLYIIMKALPVVFDNLTKSCGEIDREGFLDEIWELLKTEVLSKGGGCENEDSD